MCGREEWLWAAAGPAVINPVATTMAPTSETANPCRDSRGNLPEGSKVTPLWSVFGPARIGSEPRWPIPAERYHANAIESLAQDVSLTLANDVADHRFHVRSQRWGGRRPGDIWVMSPKDW